jgi:hypothetical protein
MGYRAGTRRGGQKFQKGPHQKKKTKTHKSYRKNKQLLEEKHVATANEITEKTLNNLKRLGEQKFAISPFSQYFDDWFLSLREVLSEFEANPDVTMDETFVKERDQILTKVDKELADLKQAEATLNQAVRELADKNHLLVKLDTEYAGQTREIGPENNAEIRELTHVVHHLEEDLEQVKVAKTSFFGFTKRAKAQKEAEIIGKLEVAKKEVERAVDKFKAAQEKLHDEYEKKKQDLIAEVKSLEREVERLETDGSIDARQAAGEALINAVNELFQRISAF